MRHLIVLCSIVLAFSCGEKPSGTDAGTGGGTATGGSGGAGGSAGSAGGSGGGTSTTGGGSGGSGGATGGSGGGTGVTYHKDINPIIQRQCIGCHDTGGIGPFALETYAQARTMAASMANAVTAKRMPPWMPSATCGTPFREERVLTPAEIALFNAWNAAGAPEGNPADAPPPFDGGMRGLTTVDATLPMTTPYTPSETLSDDYRCFILDPGNTTTKSIIGYDISPGVRAEVHHVIVYVVDKAAAQAKDAEDTTPGWQCFGGPNVNSQGAIGAWAPGSVAITYPAGTGIPLQAGKVLAMQIHYNTSATTRVPDTTSLKLQYATGNVSPAYLVPIVGDGFMIPPNAMGYSYSKEIANQYFVPIKLWGFLPHMHTKGTHIKMEATPANDCLVDIPKWDFNWQQQYFRSTPYTLSGGSKVKISCTWDNPTSSPVVWGEGTAQEMCFAYVYATVL